MRQEAARGQRILGICFGAQLLAVCLGGKAGCAQELYLHDIQYSVSEVY